MPVEQAPYRNPYRNHNRIQCIMVLSWLVAVVFSFCSLLGCETADFTVAQGVKETKIGFHIWNGFYNNTLTPTGSTSASCFGYPDNTVKDIYWRFAQAFAIIAPIWGLLWFVAAICGKLEMPNPKWGGAILTLAALFQGLTLLFLKSDLCNVNTNPFLDGVTTTEEHCTLGRSGIFSIFSICLYYLSCVIAMATPYQYASDTDLA